MDWRRHQEADLRRTLRHGLIFYAIMAMLTVPSALSNQQHRVPSVSTVPAEAPAIEVASQLESPAEIQPVDFSLADPPASVNSGDNEAATDAPPFYEHIIQAAQTYDVDPALIRAIIVAESSFNPQAVSKRGAQGLMQLMPTTAKALGVRDSFDPALNIDGGVRYFRYLLDRFEGDVRLALAAYNAGSRYVRKYGGVPPFRATQRYIRKVLRYQKKFQSEAVLNAAAEPAV